MTGGPGGSVLLVLAALALGGAVGVGWPAWRSYRSRIEQERNAERYLAWRGRGGQPGRPTEWTPTERRRLWIAGGLAAVAIGCVLAWTGLGAS